MPYIAISDRQPCCVSDSGRRCFDHCHTTVNTLDRFAQWRSSGTELRVPDHSLTPGFIAIGSAHGRLRVTALPFA
jgi:hypothetical protein